MNVPSKSDPRSILSFRKMLLNKCQWQFELERHNERDIQQMQQQIDQCHEVRGGVAEWVGG